MLMKAIENDVKITPELLEKSNVKNRAYSRDALDLAIIQNYSIG